LSAISDKTVKELAALTFTAIASNPNAGQTGNPSGSSIISTSAAFGWTPSESQGGGTLFNDRARHRHGSPSASDFESITVTVMM
jgi:hypothetical protein